MSPSLSLPVTRTAPDGPVSGPPVVLLHGFASNGAADWPAERWAQPFARAGRETLVVDLPGHGDAPAIAAAGDVTTGRVLQALADAVRAAATTAADGGFDIVGYSLGARLSWDLAGTGRLPARRLVVGGLSPAEPFSYVDLAAARAYVQGGPPPADPLTGAIAGMAAAPGQDAQSLLNLVEGLAAEPFDPAVTPPAVPTLIVAGTEDMVAHGVDGLAAAAPDATLVRVPGDHLAALTGADFPARVLAFLGITA